MTTKQIYKEINDDECQTQKRPIIISIISISLFLSGFLGAFAFFQAEQKNFFFVCLGIFTVITSFGTGIGLWLMKKWSLSLLIISTIIGILISLRLNVNLRMFDYIRELIVIIIVCYYYEKMEY
jgi:hypothetical protein